jgi:hypothetical protein
MLGHPIALDERRPPADRIAADIRRRRHGSRDGDAALVELRLDQLEDVLRARLPAATWSEAVQSVRDLAVLLALTGSAREERLGARLQRSVDDLVRLGDPQRQPS